LPLYKEGRRTMKKLLWAFIWRFFISIFVVLSADTIVSATQSPKNPYEKKYSAEQAPLLIAADPSAQQDLYARAEALYREKKYDEVIITLSGPAYADPSNFKLNVLLAKAQLEKCAILKANGDKSYKALVKDPYVTGRRLHKIDKTRPEPYYIVAKALLINNRRDRSIRTIKKALYFSPNNPEYFMVLGDAYHEMGEFEKGRGDEERFFRLAKDAYEKALKFGKDIPGFSTTVEQRIDELSKRMKGEDTETAGPQKETKIQRVKLRSTPLSTDDSDLEMMIRECNFFVKNRNDEGEFPNDFVDNGDGTITDRTTGLVWEKGGSSTAMRYRSAKRYVSRLNKKRSGGYNDWRIPTTEELASLLERDRNNRELYIAPLFDGGQKAYWTSDTVPTASNWSTRNNVIDFSKGTIDSTNSESGVSNTIGFEEGQCFIRAVRSIK
jgi:tetratricopeptide (TPR) repeat protein